MTAWCAKVMLMDQTNSLNMSGITCKQLPLTFVYAYDMCFVCVFVDGGIRTVLKRFC